MNIHDYGAHAGDGSDTTPAVRAALNDIRAQGGKTLVFPPGRYDFWPDRAVERYLFISNNTEGLKRIAFPLFDFDDLEIDGQGSQFVFHGYIVPFALRQCRNVGLHDFSVDWARTFHNEAEVRNAQGDSVDVYLPETFPYRVTHNQLVFTGEGKDTYPLGNALEFDAARRETAFQVRDNYAIHDWHHAEAIGERLVRLRTDWATLPTPGNVLALMNGDRNCPAITVGNSRDIAISDVTLHHCGGMGIVAQCTENIHLNGVRVTPTPGTGRVVSLTADATHFVNCRGKITIENSLFENQIDDATNVHGIYAKITAQLSKRELEVALQHHEQLGIDIFGAGDPVGLVRNTTLATYHQAALSGVERLNKTYTRLTFDAPLPGDVNIGDVVESHHWVPDVTIRGCVSRCNRARGFLLSTADKVRIENNHFHIPGAAILIAGDANYWFESGAVRDVTIANNHFDNCNYGVWGSAAIEITPEVPPQHRAGNDYHRHITIEGNRFDVFDPRLLKARCVDGLTFRNNTVVPSEAYPAPADAHEAFDVQDCRNVHLSDETGGLVNYQRTTSPN